MINSKYIAKIRQTKGWSQGEMAGILGVSRPTYIAIEKGLGDITVEQLSKLANKIGCNPEDILMDDILDEDKYKETIIEMIKNGADDDGRITKTKLAKLIYLTDFGWYYHNLESMTGARYRKMQQGPVPNIYFSVVDELFESGIVNINLKKDAQMIELTDAGNMVKTDKLSTKEKDFIKKIAKKWKSSRTVEIVRFTHEQLPYKICSNGEIIPYELITQQDPKYVY